MISVRNRQGNWFARIIVAVIIVVLLGLFLLARTRQASRRLPVPVHH